ncbi:hypothetical protein [Nostoc sp. GT001]|uniref:hypothetical protein n=1 Tax=unclassified Nostoc TaxID=2593658 RepID=UPI0025AAF1E5|nr:hypothetical protein [Nostoc sp. GT001]MDM9580256.1 hypothetical protein [Nostoc sp. GT001]
MRSILPHHQQCQQPSRLWRLAVGHLSKLNKLVSIDVETAIAGAEIGVRCGLQGLHEDSAFKGSIIASLA